MVTTSPLAGDSSVSPVAAERPETRPASSPPSGSALGRLVRSGWLPAAVITVFIAVMLPQYGLPLDQLAVFAGYVVVGLALPGMLWWRLARGGAHWIGEDLAAGLCVGYAFEVLTYLPARAIGVPKLTVLWAAATLIAFAAVPKLRRYWRGAGADAERPPLWWSWSVAAAIAFLMLWSASTFFRSHPLTGAQSPYVDMMFQLSLAGELKNHVPGTIPWVQGEPLNYHWFLYPEMSATSWLTGLEPLTLLYRLVLIPMLAAITLLVAITARQVTKLWWTGPAALAVFLFSFAPNPFRWAPNSVADAQSLVSTWTSPTHIFGMTLFSAVTLLTIHLLQGHGARRVLPWVVLSVLVIANSGSKATYLPMLVVGLVLAIGAHWLVNRRLFIPGLIALAITGVGVLFAQFVVLGGSSGALSVAPFATAKRFTIGTATGLTTILGHVDMPILVGLSGIAVMCWIFLWAGTFGLAAKRRLTDPSVLVLLGIALAGVGAMLTFEHGGMGQAYFFRGAGPAIALVTVAGFAAILPEQGRVRTTVLAVAGGFALGGLAATALLWTSSAKPPKVERGHAAPVAIEVGIPFVALAAFAAAVGLVLYLLRRRTTALRGLTVAIVMSVMMGFGLPSVYNRVHDAFERGFAPVSPALKRDGQPELTADGIDAARWLRAHSGPSDLVATNSHCMPTGLTVCDNRNFWVAAFSERRVLLEGWGYTDTAHKKAKGWPNPFPYLPYWDPQRLAENDAAFNTPTEENVEVLREKYGVRWLFAETRYAQQPSTDLAKYATERYQIGNYTVYELEP